MPLAKLSSKSQIVLPVEIRKQLSIKPGDLLEITLEGDSVVIHKAPDSFVDALDRCGSDLWRGYADELKKDRDEWDV